jgi:hypothetical protein
MAGSDMKRDSAFRTLVIVFTATLVVSMAALPTHARLPRAAGNYAFKDTGTVVGAAGNFHSDAVML